MANVRTSAHSVWGLQTIGIQCKAIRERGTTINQTTTVIIVEDDRSLRDLMSRMVRSVGFDAVTYSSAEEFLEGYPEVPDGPQCLVLDVRLGGMSGLGLQEQLTIQNITIPVIIVTGYSDVSVAVQAMGAGAVAFLEKPFNRCVLLETIQRSLDRDADRRRKRSLHANLHGRMGLLSVRERQVMELLMAAKGSKEIARTLGICPKTVGKHRLKLLEKLQIENVVELVRFGASS
jgi:FixJ family two-component response regulator